MDSTKKRLLVSVLLLLALLLSYARLADVASERYVDQALGNAVVTYSVVRVLNGVISVAQGSEVAISPAGVGVTLSVGEILDPVNDLIERFSWVMLVSVTSLGIQKLLVEIGASGQFSVLLTLVTAAALALLWLPGRRPRSVEIALKLAVGVIVVRFAMVIVLAANSFIYDQFMSDSYAQANAGLRESGREVDRYRLSAPGAPQPQDEALSGTAAPDGAVADEGRADSRGERPEDNSLIGMASGFFSSMGDAIDPTDKLDSLQQAAADVVQYVLSLIVIFVFQTILIPVVFLWLLYRFFVYWIGRELAVGVRDAKPEPDAPAQAGDKAGE